MIVLQAVLAVLAVGITHLDAGWSVATTVAVALVLAGLVTFGGFVDASDVSDPSGAP